MSMLLRCVLVFLFVLLISPVASSSAEFYPPRVMEFAVSTPVDSYHAKLSTLLLTEAFKRLGYGYRVKQYPMKRTIHLFKSGLIDGDAGRVFSFNAGQRESCCVRVNESTAKVCWGAYTSRQSVEINSWDDLKGKGYRVGYLAGGLLCEQNLPKLVEEGKLFRLPYSDTNGLKMVRAGRLDFFIYIDSKIAERELAGDEFKGSGVRLAGCVEQAEVYPFLHIRHAELADDLAGAMRDIKEEGLYAKFIDQAARESIKARAAELKQ